jgi:hypothetical protein
MCFISFLFLTASAINAQSVSALAAKYIDNNAVILEKQCNVQFEYNESTNLVEVTESFVIKALALVINNEISIHISYDDNSSIRDITSQPFARFTKICGDISPEGVFHSGMKMCVLKLNFKVPGDIITLKYTKHYDDIVFYNDCYFSLQYPVITSKINLQKKEGLSFDVRNFNTVDYNYLISEEKDKSGNQCIIYNCSNIPGYVEEENKPPVSFTSPHLILIPKSYIQKGKKLTFFEDIHSFYKWCKSMSDRTVNHPDQLKNTVESIIKGKSGEIEKIKAIYYWVQDKIRYIAFEQGLAGYIPESAEAVCENRFGDCKGMANLIKTMLQIAGIDARLTWVGTNDLLYDFSIPSIVSINHMVCTAIIKDRYYILDATNKYNSYDETPYSFQGKQILIEDGDNFIVYKVPEINLEKDIQISTYTYSIANENLIGKAAIQYVGSEKSNILYGINSIRVDQHKMFLEKLVSNDLSKVKTSNVTSSPIFEKEDTFEVEGNIEVNSQLMHIDNELYIQPDLFADYSSFLVSTERRNPLYFALPIHRRTIVSIDLPLGYKVSSLPKGYSFKNDFCDFNISYSFNQGKIIFIKDLKLLRTLVPKPKFQEWNDSFKLLKKAVSQQIVLNK